MNNKIKDFQSVEFGDEARKEMLKGATILYRAVKSTMGPSGLNVIIDTPIGPPFITKDGNNTAKSINLKDKLPRMGANLLKEIANKTNEVAGDATTTATVLGYNMFYEGTKMIATGRSSIGIKKGMDFATKKIVEYLKNISIKVRDTTDIINIGTISANGERQIGELLTEAINKVGSDGIITIEPSKTIDTYLEIVEGMMFDNGYLSPYFITNQEKMTVELDNPFILITNKKLSSLKEILPILEKVLAQKKQLLIIGDEIDGEVLHALIVNKMKGLLINCAIKAPSYGEFRTDLLTDVALLTGGQVFDSSFNLSLQNASLEHLGKCKKVIISRNSTTIVCDSTSTEAKEKINNRVYQLKKILEEDLSLDDLRKEKYKQRLAKLSGGVAIVRVGGTTEVEMLEKKDRVEDALNATIAAVQEGIIPGGGTALFYATDFLENFLENYLPNNIKLNEDEMAGIEVVLKSCKTPLKTIVENTGKSYEVVMNKLKENIGKQNWQNYGYNAATEEYGNLVDGGVIDPIRITRSALENATSIVGLMLTCEAVIINEEEE